MPINCREKGGEEGREFDEKTALRQRSRKSGRRMETEIDGAGEVVDRNEEKGDGKHG